MLDTLIEEMLGWSVLNALPLADLDCFGRVSMEAELSHRPSQNSVQNGRDRNTNIAKAAPLGSS